MKLIVILLIALVAFASANPLSANTGVNPDHTNSESTVNLAYDRQPYFTVVGVKCEDRCDAGENLEKGQWSINFFTYENDAQCGVSFNTQWKPWTLDGGALSTINFAASCRNSDLGAQIGISAASVPAPSKKMKKGDTTPVSVSTEPCPMTSSVYVNAWEYEDCGYGEHGKVKSILPYGTKGGYFNGCYTRVLNIQYDFTCGVEVSPAQADQIPFKCYNYKTNLTCNRDYCGRPTITDCDTTLDKEDKDYQRGGFIFETTLDVTEGLAEQCLDLPDACQNGNSGQNFPVCCEGINYHDCYRGNYFDDQDTFYPTNNKKHK